MLVLKPHTRDLGGFTVQRLLPSLPAKMIGPFIFFDHFGPVEWLPGSGADVRPHPHIGLATVTYLFEGDMVHRDSLGSVQRIEPGAVNWMTAGSGIVHSERSTPEARARGHRMHGIQTWVALPKAQERADPSFTHLPSSALPEIARPGVTMRLLAGSAFGQRAPTPVFSPMHYLAVHMQPGAALELPAEHEARGVFAVAGGLRIAGVPLDEGHLGVLDPGSVPRLEAPAGARAMLLGGAPLPGDYHIWWNFVASSRELIDAASQRWQERAFPPVPGETEFIPLPAPH